MAHHDMNTFKKGDVVEAYGNRQTVAYTSGPYVYLTNGRHADYSNCKLVPQHKFGPGDVVSNGSSTGTIKCVKTTHYNGEPYSGDVAYDYKDSYVGAWDYERHLTLVRRANSTPNFGIGDTVRSKFGEAVVEKVLENGNYTVRYDNNLGSCTNTESFYTLVRRANPAPTLGYAAAPLPTLKTVFDHINAGRLIEATKQYRTIYGVGLKEAKDAVEAIREAMKLLAPDKFKVGDSVVTSAVDDAGVGTITRKNADGTYGVQFGRPYGHCHEEERCLSLAAPVTARDSIVIRFENGKYQPNSPPKVHPTLAEATAEAERLARKEPGIAFGAFSLATTSTATKPVVATVKA